jgi:hypothetical protein
MAEPDRPAPLVEFLWWADCPSWDRALSELRAEMESIGLDPASVQLREVETDADAEALGFAGSPTIRIDGRDIADPGETAPGLNCRVYRLRDGRISALPDREDVRDALAAARGSALPAPAGNDRG